MGFSKPYALVYFGDVTFAFATACGSKDEFIPVVQAR